jgi:DNA-directed RNA polymerase specialized sigma24 family protein
MSKSTKNLSARVWFSQFATLAYWIARKWTRGIKACQGVFLTTDELEELTQDAVCRGWDRFSRRCESGIPSDEETAKEWLCQCSLYAARDTVRRKSAFGTESTPAQIRGDAYQRFQREGRNLRYVPQRGKPEFSDDTDLRAFVDRELAELSPKLRDVAYQLALGHTHVTIASDLGIAERTVRNRRKAIREHLAPTPNVYATIVAAVEACRDKPRKRNSQPLSPILEAALAG